MRAIGHWFIWIWAGIKFIDIVGGFKAALIGLFPSGAALFISSLVFSWRAAVITGVLVFLTACFFLAGWLGQRRLQKDYREQLGQLYRAAGRDAGQMLYSACYGFFDRARVQGGWSHIASRMVQEYMLNELQNLLLVFDNVHIEGNKRFQWSEEQSKFIQYYRIYYRLAYTLRDAGEASGYDLITDQALRVWCRADIEFIGGLRKVITQSGFENMFEELKGQLPPPGMSVGQHLDMC
jgi:hypothetical protein